MIIYKKTVNRAATSFVKGWCGGGTLCMRIGKPTRVYTTNITSGYSNSKYI